MHADFEHGWLTLLSWSISYQNNSKTTVGSESSQSCYLANENQPFCKCGPLLYWAEQKPLLDKYLPCLSAVVC